MLLLNDSHRALHFCSPVFRGHAATRMPLSDPAKTKSEPANHLVKMHADKREDNDREIVASSLKGLGLHGSILLTIASELENTRGAL